MLVSQDQSQNVTQTQKIAPHLIQASEVLQYSAIELTQAVERELLENPALDCVETSQELCPGCPSLHAGCERCPFTAATTADRIVEGATFSEMVTGETEASQASDSAEPEREKADDSDVQDPWSLDLTTFYEDGQEQALPSDEPYDPLATATATATLRDHLMSSILSMSDGAADERLAEYLVSSLDARGWLKIDDYEAIEQLGLTVEQLQEGIRSLQACDPAGIGARDLRDCVLLQLRNLQEEGRGHPLLMTLVERYWDDIVQRKYQYLARRTHSTTEDIEAAMRYLRTEITPNPASQFRQPWEYKPDSKSEAVRPDVVIRRTPTGFDIEVLGLEIPLMHVNARYRALYELLRCPPDATLSQERQAERASVLARLSPQERDHIIQHVERARLFIKNIQQRRRTIERITRCLIEAQQGFIETGSFAFLQPMTRTELALHAQVHESTVSRALLRKYVQLPNQDVLSFEEFFTSAGSLKDTIHQLIAAEDPANPYSDEKIRKILVDAGHKIARRTVVKYRESMRIPASYLRRKPV
ncbi:MAG: RNA polymerase factor sigma-54 [Capsulimonadaceae bacterium]|nr:RNA polymerase factor sigma-54 [Capsulimonadaceae bacterium]